MSILAPGQALVNGKFSNDLTVRASEFDPTRLEVAYVNAGAVTPLDSSLTGGTMGGLMEFRTRMLDPARQALGETALALADSFNQQHRTGMDLNGALGGNFFNIATTKVLASNINSGSGALQTTVSDISALAGDDYIFEFDGAAYSLTRADSGAPVPMGGAGSAGESFLPRRDSVLLSAVRQPRVIAS